MAHRAPQPGTTTVMALLAGWIVGVAALAGCSSATPSASGAPTWVQQRPAASPPPARDSAMAYDPAIAALVLIGGQGAASPGCCTSTGCSPNTPPCLIRDTWLYDGKTWTRGSPPVSPPARMGAAMAYDPTLRGLVLYGGHLPYSGTVFTDTWIFDGKTWTERHPAQSPSVQGQLVYDAALRRLVLFGEGVGPTGTATGSETWTYDGATWTKLPGGASPPAPRPMAYDATLGEVVLYAGSDGVTDSTWVLDGTGWTRRTPTASPQLVGGVSLAFDPALRRTVLFGGYPYDAASRGGSGVPANRTWIYDGTTWTELSPSVAPTARGEALMAYDEATKRLVLFGGQGPGLPDPFGAGTPQTWTYGG